MAEISGNNIRSLEASASVAPTSPRSARPQVPSSPPRTSTRGQDLLQHRAQDHHVDTVQRVVEEFYHVSHEELVGNAAAASPLRATWRSTSPTTSAR
ncbi:MAG: hypothetical protein ACLTKG_02650 [Collinsella intestinalis]